MTVPSTTSGILVVDDEAMMRRAVVRVLRPLDSGIREATDADSAMALIEAAPPAVLITDFMMPGRSGRQLAEEVHARFPDVQIVVHSGNAAHELPGQWWPDFDVTIVPKPAIPDLLFAVVEAKLQDT